MFYLSTTLLIWAFSFSLIGNYLSGQVDDWFAVLIRIALAFVLFIPFFRRAHLTDKYIVGYMLVGACQLGLMYLFYYPAFHYLSVPEVLLFTITTPIYVTLLYDLLSIRRVRLGYFASALLAVLGAMIIRYSQVNLHFWLGLGLIQLANICFAIGQIGYKRMLERQVSPMPQSQAFFWFYMGALVVATVGWLIYGNPHKLPANLFQWAILLWLGIVASGLGYFLWNKGVVRVNAGTLAIMNNMLIPLGVTVNLLFWHGTADLPRLIVGAAVMFSALWLHSSWVQKRYI